MHLTRLTLLALALGALILAAWLSGCGGSSAAPAASVSSSSAGPDTASPPSVTPASAVPVPKTPVKPVDPIVVVHTTAGDFQLLLFAEKSPATVDNFLTNYVSRGFYDETIFHHVEQGSMLIGGGYPADSHHSPTPT